MVLIQLTNFLTSGYANLYKRSVYSARATRKVGKSKMMEALRNKGDCWNESETYKDSMTLRTVRRYTSTGLFNTTPTYHTNTAFTEDGEFFVFARGHEGRSAVFKACLTTGEITQLIDPVEGIGNWGGIQARPKSRYSDGAGISGTVICVAPKMRWLVFHAGRSVRAVHLESLEERILVEDIGLEWMAGVISIDPTETRVMYPLKPSHPDVASGRPPARGYMEYFAEGGMCTRLMEIPLMGGTPEIVHEEEGPGCAHCPHNPVDGDLVLIDRDLAPGFWGGSDNSRTTRCWTVRLSTHELTELRPANQKRFQVHSGWTWDGQHVIYHGSGASGGYYIGVIDTEGDIMREWDFTEAASYGHVSSASDRPAIILDGNLTDDLLLWLYYDSESPRVEIIARHGTEWKGAPGQLPHPHPQSDPTGRWVSFNACHDARTDVFAVAI